MAKVVLLKEIAEIIMGQSPKGETYNDKMQGIPLINGASDYKGNIFNPKVYTSKPNKIIEKGDIIFGVRATIGNLAFSDGRYCIGRGCAAVRIDEHLALSKFVVIFIDEALKDLDAKANGSTFKNLKKESIENIEIPLPPIEIQQKIVQVLDKAQSLIDKRKEQIELMDELIQSTFYEMFGDPVVNQKGWVTTILNECCYKITDGTHGTPIRQKYGFPFITGKHIRPNQILYNQSEFISENDHKIIYRRCNPEKYDVLYTNIGVNLGTAALNIADYEFSMKNVALLKYDRAKLDGRYLERMLNSTSFVSRIKYISSIGGAQSFLSLKDIKRLLIIIPPIELQNQFAEIVEKIESQKQLMEQSLDEMENNFNSLMQRAFSEKGFN